MKKIVKVLAGIVGLFLLAIIILPFVIDVDQYRPKIVKAANEQLNGSLELGKLKLSLWGKIDIGIDGLKLLDAHQKIIVSVKDASFNMPYFSVLSGSPLITLSLKQPEINVIKNKEGKLNLLALMKTGSAPTATTPNSQAVSQASNSQKIELPAIAVNAHFGVFIENAKVIYQDEAMALTNTVDQLNLRIKDFSLSRKTELELWADLKTKMGTDLALEGPLKLIAELKPEMSGGEFKSASLVATFTADDLAIEKGQLFSKKKGVPLHFSFDGNLSQEALKLNNASLKFHNAEVVVQGEYHKINGANIHFEAKPIELKSWSDLVPMLKEYELEGALGLNGNVKGKPEVLNYDAKLLVKNLAMKGPNLKAKPLINAEVDVTTDRIEKFWLDLKGPGNEMRLEGKLNSFSKPQFTFNFTSPKGLDLDQWIEFPKTEPVTKTGATEKASEKSSEKTASGENSKTNLAAPVDFDAMLDPLRKNPMMKDFIMDGSIAIAFIKAKGTRIDDLAAKVQFKNLVAAITGFKMKVFDGAINGAVTVDLKPSAPQYTMALSVIGFDMQKAVEGQMPTFKNTIVGKLNTSIQGGGSSFNSETIKRKLQLKGEFKIVNAQFKSLDIAKMASDALTGAVAKIGDKVPLLKGKKIDSRANVGSKYELISSNFTIQNGVLDAPNFIAKAAVKQGIDLKGSTKMWLIDESIDAKWEMIDTQKLTGADQFSVNVAGKNINNVLAKSETDPVILPITVTGKWSSPSTHYDQVVEYLAGVAGKRLGGAATEAVKAQAKSAVQDAVKKAIGNQNLGDGLKKLFGH